MQTNKKFNRRQFLKSSLKPSAPNFVLFIADDLSILDAGCYGNKVIKTPNIDQLAKEGLRFKRVYTATAMCAPSRSMLFTGLYPHRNGCHMNHGPVSEGIKSLPHFLKQLGYRVVLSGKRHIKPEKNFPFEYMDFKKNDRKVKKLDYDKMDKFISSSDSPFCLAIASAEPHAPHKSGTYKPEDVSLPQNWVDTPETRKLFADYCTDVDNLDKEVGQVNALLEKNKKKNNTIFIFLSDHGHEYFAKWTCYNPGLNVPFIVRWPENIKADSTTDALISFVDVLPTLIDLANGQDNIDFDGKSFLPVLRGDKSEHHQYVFGAHTNRGIISGTSYPIRSVIGKKYQYIRNLNHEGLFQCVATHGLNYTEVDDGIWGSWKRKAKTDLTAKELVHKFRKRPEEELYNLESDPLGQNNLVDDPAYKEIKSSMRQELDKWMESQDDKGIESEMAVNKFPSRSK